MTTLNLTTPIQEKQIRKLHIGDHIMISGIIFTARDEAHIRALEYAKNGTPLPFETQDSVLYHCGPIARQIKSRWEILSAGPTTSVRLKSTEFIKRFGIRVIIGKGGMPEQVKEVLRRYGAIYCSFPGGAGVFAANFIQSVERVVWVDLGIPEAVWILKVNQFPLLVSMDSHGLSLYSKVYDHVLTQKNLLLEKLNAQK
ncbi:MAG: FumA C-terminus/TtdB family hydratase beta subunit [Promethearchaeota archaeon]